MPEGFVVFPQKLASLQSYWLRASHLLMQARCETWWWRSVCRKIKKQHTCLWLEVRGVSSYPERCMTGCKNPGSSLLAVYYGCSPVYCGMPSCILWDVVQKLWKDVCSSIKRHRFQIFQFDSVAATNITTKTPFKEERGYFSSQITVHRWGKSGHDLAAESIDGC